jgi:hypothetical protein
MAFAANLNPTCPESSNFFFYVQFNENFSHQSPMATEVAEPQGTWENVCNFAFFPSLFLKENRLSFLSNWIEN